MRAIEFIAEANINAGIDQALKQKGYKRIGRGTDQNVYLEPGTGMVMKIFRSNASSEGSDQITPGQRTLKAFADYCHANTDNEFLPNFTGWETFKFNNRIYLQIRMERLFSLNPDWGDFLEGMAGMARVSNSADHKDVFIRDTIEDDSRWDNTNGAEMLSMLGSDGFNQVWDTITDLSRIADHGRFKMDLHSGNFMLGSDGHVVISDPFFLGWNHPDLKTTSGEDEEADEWATSDAEEVDGSMERSFHGSEEEDETP